MKRRQADRKKGKVGFLKYIAEELEQSEGLKMYQVIGSKCKVSVNVPFISAFMFNRVNFKSTADKAC